MNIWVIGEENKLLFKCPGSDPGVFLFKGNGKSLNASGKVCVALPSVCKNCNLTLLRLSPQIHSSQQSPVILCLIASV